MTGKPVCSSGYLLKDCQMFDLLFDIEHLICFQVCDVNASKDSYLISYY